MQRFALFFLLAGCASIEAPPGMQCDPSGACWPYPLPAISSKYVVQNVPQSQIRAMHAEIKGAHSNAIAFTKLAAEPAIIYLPTGLTYRQVGCGWTMQLLLNHELGHLARVTRHGVVKKVSC